MNHLNLNDQQREMALKTAKAPMPKDAVAYVFGLEAELMSHHRPVIEISREEPYVCDIIKPEQVEYVFNWYENFYVKYFPAEHDTAEVEDENDKIWQDEVEAMEEEPDDRRQAPRRRPERDQEKSQEQLDAEIADAQIRARRQKQEKAMKNLISKNNKEIAAECNQTETDYLLSTDANAKRIHESISQVGDAQHTEREINIQDKHWPRGGITSAQPNLDVAIKGLQVPEALRRDMVTLLQLARIKWGNADPDVDQALQAITEKYDLD